MRLVRYEVVRLFAKVAKCGSEFGILIICTSDFFPVMFGSCCRMMFMLVS